jgi:hypothetical protein
MTPARDERWPGGAIGLSRKDLTVAAQRRTFTGLPSVPGMCEMVSTSGDKRQTQYFRCFCPAAVLPPSPPFIAPQWKRRVKRDKMTDMRRAFSIITMLMVLLTGSAFPLACALACKLPAAAQADTTQPCHQEAEPKALAGPGWGKLVAACPVLAALNGRVVVQVPLSSAEPKRQVPATGLLSLETSLLAANPPLSASLRPGGAPPEPALPLYLRNRVLRL